MGINPIEYHPWKGVRTAQNLRLYVIARSVIRHKIGSLGVIILLVIGFLLVHAFSLITIILVNHEKLEASQMNSYLGGGLFVIFSMLLAAIVTSDLISEDIASSSFVLYFSRALKVRDYLAGKAAGALLVMSLFCALPPILVAFVSIATQTGGDYWHSLGILGETALVGALVTIFFVPFGMMISCFTRRKSYAAVGTFMSFFVLVVVAGLFSQFSRGWRVISPIDALAYLFSWFFGEPVPSYVDKGALGLIVASLIIVPAVVVYYRLTRQVVGK
jgi:ABC-type transport system involved in multi-copper enzyme maturation permease subunit